MSLSMYQASIPVFIRQLGILSSILKKGEINANERKIDPLVFTNARLAPDMFPLTRQVQIATDVIKGGAGRLAGAEIPSFADTETTFEELYARIAKTVDYLKSLKPAQLEGAQARQINLKVGGRDLEFTGADYLTNIVLPNLYFHITTTYAILRHNGVPLGKGDYLGA